MRKTFHNRARIFFALSGLVFFELENFTFAQALPRVESNPESVAAHAADSAMVSVSQAGTALSGCGAQPNLFPRTTSWSDYIARETAQSLRPVCDPAHGVTENCSSVEAAALNSGPLRESVSMEEANAIFNHVRGIPMAWNFPYTGCYARAHLLSRFLEANGIASEKVVVDAGPGDINLGPTPRPPAFTGWPYHIATIINVRQGTQTVQMVIDPALMTRPVPIADWIRAQGGAPNPALARQARPQPQRAPRAPRPAGPSRNAAASVSQNADGSFEIHRPNQAQAEASSGTGGVVEVRAHAPNTQALAQGCSQIHDTDSEAQMANRCVWYTTSRYQREALSFGRGIRGSDAARSAWDQVDVTGALEAVTNFQESATRIQESDEGQNRLRQACIELRRTLRGGNIMLSQDCPTM